MPKSKRNKVVNLTKVDKKGKELNQKVYAQVRDCLDEYTYCWVFSVDNMRNTHLKQVRAEFSDSRMFFGKTKVMAKALGTSREDEYKENISKLSKHLTGNVGLIFTNRTPEAISSYFDNYSALDYARAGFVSPLTLTVPAGTVFSRGGQIPNTEDVPLAHSLETEVRKLGMPTRLVNGKVTLNEEYIVCEEGDVMNSKQTSLLKLFGVATADFKVNLLAYWCATDNDVKETNSMEEEEEE